MGSPITVMQISLNCTCSFPQDDSTISAWFSQWYGWWIVTISSIFQKLSSSYSQPTRLSYKILTFSLIYLHWPQLNMQDTWELYLMTNFISLLLLNFSSFPYLDHFTPLMSVCCLCRLSVARGRSRDSFQLCCLGGGMTYLVLSIPATALVYLKNA